MLQGTYVHKITFYFTKLILGKTLVVKHKAMITSDQEEEANGVEMNKEVCPVYFISLVGGFSSLPGKPNKMEGEDGLFDLYTKFYDFYQKENSGRVIIVKTAKDIQHWFNSFDIGINNMRSKHVDIYTMVEMFIKVHSNSHFFIDECPFIPAKRGN